jgi:hypothetical protein
LPSDWPGTWQRIRCGDGPNDGESITGCRDIVDPQDGRAALDGEHSGGHGGGEAVVHVAPGQLA